MMKRQYCNIIQRGSDSERDPDETLLQAASECLCQHKRDAPLSAMRGCYALHSNKPGWYHEQSRP